MKNYTKIVGLVSGVVTLLLGIISSTEVVLLMNQKLNENNIGIFGSYTSLLVNIIVIVVGIFGIIGGIISTKFPFISFLFYFFCFLFMFWFAQAVARTDLVNVFLGYFLAAAFFLVSTLCFITFIKRYNI